MHAIVTVGDVRGGVAAAGASRRGRGIARLLRRVRVVPCSHRGNRELREDVRSGRADLRSGHLVGAVGLILICGRQPRREQEARARHRVIRHARLPELWHRELRDGAAVHPATLEGGRAWRGAQRRTQRGQRERGEPCTGVRVRPKPTSHGPCLVVRGERVARRWPEGRYGSGRGRWRLDVVLDLVAWPLGGHVAEIGQRNRRVHVRPEQRGGVADRV